MKQAIRICILSPKELPMTGRAVRMAGEYHGQCPQCDAHSSFAFGFADDRAPRAIAWEGPSYVDVDIRNIQLVKQVDDDLWITLEYACCECGTWNKIQTTCRPDPPNPQASNADHDE